MAYPIITDFFRAQVILHHESGLPEDVFVNNLYFRNDNVGGDYDTVYDAIFAVVDAFYGVAHAPASSSIASFLSDGIFKASLKVYDLGAALPRYPINDREDLFAWSGQTGTPQPGELAACLSFKAAPGPRRRGRIYLGPFNTSANEVLSGRAVVSSSLRTAATNAAVNMLNTTENVTWSVVSPTDAGGFPVVDGWMDEAWDIQRSRGRRAQGRYTYDASGVTAG